MSDLDFIYKQNLEKDIVARLAEVKKIDVMQAMDLYYNSRLAKQIEQGLYGIENMDYKYLVDDLIDNELNKI